MLAKRPICLLLLLALASGVAFAADPRPESAPLSSAPAQKSAQEIQAIKERVSDWLKTCLTDWDQATHMTKKEWRTTCQRVAAERGKFLLENPTAEALSTRRR
jgi:hypothetical protein